MKISLLFVFAVVSLFCLSEPVFAAAAAGGGLPWDSWLDKVVASITGPFAFGASILGMAGAGAMLIFGGQEINAALRALLYIVLVLAFLVAAKNMVSTITGVGAEIPVSQPTHSINNFYGNKNISYP